MRKQPFSDVLAQQRAYSLKQGYINKIILASYLDSELSHQLKISPKKLKKLQTKYSSENIVKSVKAYKKGETFEQLVERKMKPFYGKTITQISRQLNMEFNCASKDFAYHVCRDIFGVKSKHIKEFENADISLKTIALESDRDYIKESMSFPYIRFVDIVNQEWEDSEWYKILTSKFFFVVFRKSPDNRRENMKLEKVFFWNMPYSDLSIARWLWCDTRNKVLEGDYDNFITTKTNNSKNKKMDMLFFIFY